MAQQVDVIALGGRANGETIRIEFGSMTYSLDDERYLLVDAEGLPGDRALVPEDDVALRAAYQLTDGVPGNPEADALLKEIEHRGLDI